MTVADPLRLSRRDRAALTLALECLRAECPSRGDRSAWDYLDDARNVLGIGSYAEGMAGAVHDALYAAGPWRSARLLRARLALLLRALLRADALERESEELGLSCAWTLRWCAVCDGCGESLPNYAIGEPVNVCPKRGGHPVARRARPLWESAPKTRAR